MIETGKIINGDCVEVMKTLPEGCIDLLCTSPPYSVNVKYDVYDDTIPMDEYWKFTTDWLSEAFRVLKDDGRIAVNVPIETNVQERGGRILFNAEFWMRMKEVGFQFFGMVDLSEDSPHRVRQTAWGCYDNETKVMTNNGLKFFKDVDIETDLFMTLNPITKEIEYQKAFDYIEKPFKGKLVNIKSRSINLTITENHNMVRINNSEIDIIPFNEIKQETFTIPRKHNGLKNYVDVETIVIPPVEYGLRTKKIYRNENSLIVDTDDWLRFLGIFLTDGSLTYDVKRGIYKISIYQTKTNFLKEIEDLLERLPFNFEYKKQKNEYYCCSKQLASFLLDTKSKNLRTIPDYVFSMSKRQKEILLLWLFYGDGSFTKNNELWKISVCSEIMKDQIIRLLFESGRICSLYSYYPKDRVWNGKLIKSNYPMTTIQVLNKEQTYVKKKNITMVDYDDKVYCVSVPNKTLLVEKSGQLVWCGNSWMSASSPYIYNPKECVILAYKKSKKKLEKGESQWFGTPTKIVLEDGTLKNKVVYEDEDKKDFMNLVFGRWDYFADTKSLTKATFSMDIPTKAIKILSYKNDIVLDPFNGSGTSCLAAEILGRKWIGIELSEEYSKIARNRILEYQVKTTQTELEFKENYKL
jgi:DNA modification methylase